MTTQYFVQNQAPKDLDPLAITPHLTTDPNDPNTEYNIATALTDPINDAWFTPMQAGQNVSVTRHNGVHTDTLSPEDVATMIAEVANPDEDSNTTGTAENADVTRLTEALSVHALSNHRLPADRLFVSQALGRCRLPAAGPLVTYTTSQDIIPTAKALCSDQSLPNWDMFFTAIASTFDPHVYGVGMLGKPQFDDFKQHLANLAQALGNNLSNDTQVKLRQFQNIDFDGLTEAQLLRNDCFDYTDDYSYARVLIYAVHSWVQNQHANGTANTPATALGTLMPFSLAETVMPEAIVFVNVDAHAHTSARIIDAEWKNIVDSVNMVQPPVSLRNINSLTATAVQMKKVTAEAVRAKRRMKDPATKREIPPLVTTQPKVVDIAKSVDRLVTRMGQVAKSQNTFKAKTKTRSKPSRRRPDNVDARGTRIKKTFYPDIHFYADCSGSMSVDNFEGIAKTIAMVAAKRKVNIYFTSFSDVLSQDVLIPAAGKSPSEIMRIIRNIPKVGGGTNFEIIWDHINESPERSQRCNIIATDFEFYPHSNAKHSKNTFYAPCDMGDWDMVKNSIEYFTKSMMPIDATIPGRILGVY